MDDLLTNHRVRPIFVGTAILVFQLVAFVTSAEEKPAHLKPIGGRWYINDQNREKPIYLYRDDDRYLDLFSYHAQDSNNDGIENIKLSHDDKCLIMKSQGYPNHPTAIFPNSDNPNSIRIQQFTFRLPLEPKLANTITRLPMGPIGTALNGVVFFNPFEAGGMNAVEGYSEVWLDSCCGHPAPNGIYHYHKYPSCVKSPFTDNGKQHSPVIGFAFDGFPVYGPYESAGVLAKDLDADSGKGLDVCNGHSDEIRGYHYHVTPGRFPYILGGYSGVVEPSNNHELRRPRQGAIENNAKPGTTMNQVLASVRPGTASRGKTHTIQLELNAVTATRHRLPDGKPSWVQIGPYEAKTISRQGNLVSAEIEIPSDATLGVLLDCHLEFTGQGGGRPTVFKKNDAFRVVE
ncbi:YHYH protein [Schlesneria paludicola]|uniref:YHYH protein n=1 Tax=Schlesneria paludicola TaxID=360056 RepID=UPI00029AF9F2|nr:YHYH protein [Schlesneria paludicola]